MATSIPSVRRAPEGLAAESPDLLLLQKSHGLGGSERHILDLAEGLGRRGVRPAILWLIDPRRSPEQLLAACRARRIPTETLPIRGDLDLRLVRALRRHLRRRRPRLLHVHLIHARLHGVLAAHGLPVPIVATRHGYEPHRRWPWFRLLSSGLDRRCARVIVPSRFLERFARRWEGTPPARLRVIPHGVGPESFAPRDPEECTRLRAAWGASPDALVIGCTARLHPAKDHATLIDAFGQLVARFPQAHLVLIGDGPLRARLLRRARRRLGPATARMHLTGEVVAVAPRLASCDLAVLPTRREGFGLAALEAQAAGLPLVASAVGAVPELVEPEESGLLVPPRDAGALARALERLLRDPALRARLGRQARARARRFSLDRMVRETQALYAELWPPAAATDRSSAAAEGAARRECPEGGRDDAG